MFTLSLMYVFRQTIAVQQLLPTTNTTTTTSSSNNNSITKREIETVHHSFSFIEPTRKKALSPHSPYFPHWVLLRKPTF